MLLFRSKAVRRKNILLILCFLLGLSDIRSLYYRCSLTQKLFILLVRGPDWNQSSALPTHSRSTWDPWNTPFTDGKGDQEEYYHAICFWNAFCKMLSEGNCKLPNNLQSLFLPSQLFCRAKGLCSGLIDDRLAQPKAVQISMNRIYEKNAISVCSETFRSLTMLWNIERSFEQMAFLSSGHKLQFDLEYYKATWVNYFLLAVCKFEGIWSTVSNSFASAALTDDNLGAKCFKWPFPLCNDSSARLNGCLKGVIQKVIELIIQEITALIQTQLDVLGITMDVHIETLATNQLLNHSICSVMESGCALCGKLGQCKRHQSWWVIV